MLVLIEYIITSITQKLKFQNKRMRLFCFTYLYFYLQYLPIIINKNIQNRVIVKRALHICLPGVVYPGVINV